jgi:hypothetical protein
MKYTHSQGDYDFYIDTLLNKELIIRRHKVTQEILFDAECVAKILGFESLKIMIESNKEFENMFLDALNDGKAKAFKKINLSDNPF